MSLIAVPAKNLAPGVVETSLLYLMVPTVSQHTEHNAILWPRRKKVYRLPRKNVSGWNFCVWCRLWFVATSSR
ncbi:hypothetical protein M378DRAFT_168287 [Amanita muscaria Koide BX008]|uniref:Uncharacterized protein n=1 Tax=Amanita muscaria (strain Koide BX008) TaxID=946122 RepID=A0A0C2WVA7_AMAMK|nr:hypothetical protein M378DRAFT_168287 [Amanita muscaria Koide BX008]